MELIPRTYVLRARGQAPLLTSSSESLRRILFAASRRPQCHNHECVWIRRKKKKRPSHLCSLLLPRALRIYYNKSFLLTSSFSLLEKVFDENLLHFQEEISRKNEIVTPNMRAGSKEMGGFNGSHGIVGGKSSRWMVPAFWQLKRHHLEKKRSWLVIQKFSLHGYRYTPDHIDHSEVDKPPPVFTYLEIWSSVQSR